MAREEGTVIIIFKSNVHIEKLLKNKHGRLSGAAARTGILGKKENKIYIKRRGM